MYIVVEGDEKLFLGCFKTSELARLWAEQQPSSNLCVLEVIPNYPEQTKKMFGPFPGNGSTPDSETAPDSEEAPEVVTAPDSEETPEVATAPDSEETPEVATAPKPKKAPKTEKAARTRISKERVQECCDTVVGMMAPKQAYKRSFFLDEGGLSAPEWTKVIQKLIQEGTLYQEGVKKGAVYFLSGGLEVRADEETTEETTEGTTEE